ncbi:MAG TPA: hypothetical protein VMJ74_12965 [Pseudomonadales bacterium]|nr:hypothetical protein [Pseudomonadales bacterium]
MSRLSLFLSIVACVVVFPVGAEDVSDGGAAAAAPAEPPTVTETTAAANSNYENRRICRAQTVTGSRIPQTVCSTQSQMDARRKHDQAWKNALDIQRLRVAPPGGGVVSG